MRTSACFCFLFQAEDGIRDLTVTGVQTCALPIWRGAEDIGRELQGRADPQLDPAGAGYHVAGGQHPAGALDAHRADRGSEKHTSELHSPAKLGCPPLPGKKKMSDGLKRVR